MADLKLIPGSIYRVRSVGGNDEAILTEGEFTGLTTIGSIDALVLELPDGDGEGVRLIPTHTILLLDILEQGEHPEESDDESQHYV